MEEQNHRGYLRQTQKIQAVMRPIPEATLSYDAVAVV